MLRNTNSLLLAVLAFLALPSNKPKASNKNKGILRFLSPTIFFFIGVLELKEETIESLLAAACLLQLSQVIEVCCNFLMKQLHPSNCLGIRSFADAQGCMDLLNVAHNYTMVRLVLCLE